MARATYITSMHHILYRLFISLYPYIFVDQIPVISTNEKTIPKIEKKLRKQPFHLTTSAEN